MIDVTKNKIIGAGALRTINASLDIKYGEEYVGVTEQDATTQLIVTLMSVTHESAVRSLMNSYETLTCDATGLTINTDMGGIIVGDVTNISADNNDKKYVLMVMAVDNTTGNPSVYAFQKTTGEYGTLPASKSLATRIKEYSVVAGGNTLVEINNFI